MVNKKLTIDQLVFFQLIFLTPKNSQSQWQSDVRLTNDSAVSDTSDNNARCVLSNGDQYILFGQIIEAEL